MFSANCTKFTRRRWLAASFAAAAGCGRSKGTGFPGYALVATAGINSLAAVDLTAFRLARTIPLNAPPTSIVTGGAQSYALTPSNGTVHVIDANLNRLSSRRWSDELATLDITTQGTMLVASGPRELIFADAASLKVVSRYKLGAPPVDLDLSSTGLIASSGGARATVELFDLKTGSKQTRTMPGEIGSLKFRKDGKVLLVANYHDGSLTLLDVPTLQTIVDLPLAMRPENLCFNTDQGQLFVSGTGMDAVAVVFPYQMEVEQTVLAGRAPGTMACSDTPAYLFVASRDGSDVCVLNVANRKVIGIVQVGEEPRFITVTPDNQYALVLNQRSGDIAVIRIPAIHANKHRSGVSLLTMIPVGEKPVSAAIIRRA